MKFSVFLVCGQFGHIPISKPLILIIYWRSLEFDAQHALHERGEISFLFLATPPPPLFRLVSNAFADFGLVGRIGKKAEKKIQNVSE